LTTSERNGVRRRYGEEARAGVANVG
jgi:hypothetical protein